MSRFSRLRRQKEQEKKDIARRRKQQEQKKDIVTSSNVAHDVIIDEQEQKKGIATRSRSSNMEMNLPHDLVTDILLRLPVSSLIRFSCVCKSWRSLTEYVNEIQTGIQCAHHPYSNPDHTSISFLILRVEYTSCLFPRPKLFIEDLICNDVSKSFRFSINQITPLEHPPMSDYLDLGGTVFVIGTCNGLICLSTSKGDKRAHVYNPITREYVHLPHPNPAVKYLEIEHGFGYHPTTKEYKILRVVRWKSDVGGNIMRGTSVHVYTLGGTGTWRNIELDQVHNQHYSMKIGPLVHLDGSLYWVCYTGMTAHNITYFDLGHEVLRMMPVPQSAHLIDDRYYRLGLGLLGRNLCVIEIMKDNEINLWVMKSDEKRINGYSWSKDFIIREASLIHSLLQNQNHWRNYYHPELLIRATPEILIRDGGRTIIFLVCMTNGSRFVFCFDNKMGKTSRTSLPEPFVDTKGRVYTPWWRDLRWRVVPYIRSIVSLKDLGEKDVKMVHIQKKM